METPAISKKCAMYCRFGQARQLDEKVTRDQVERVENYVDQNGFPVQHDHVHITDHMQKAAIYVRCASPENLEENLNEQIDYCLNFAGAEGISVETRHIYNEGARHTALDRPELKSLIRAAGERDFDVVLVEDLSRLDRRPHQLLACIEELTAMGVDIISVAGKLTINAADINAQGAFDEA